MARHEGYQRAECGKVIPPRYRATPFKSVAEGVESQSDWDVLKAAGCDVAQGYFIARPMDEGSLLEFCAAQPDALKSYRDDPGPAK
ncbi:MAG: EAL domain-containing protein [Betaproteobacteria bacterium]|nr:EAL domain-containing protein [Betaproteobacteria bacterium]